MCRKMAPPDYQIIEKFSLKISLNFFFFFAKNYAFLVRHIIRTLFNASGGIVYVCSCYHVMFQLQADFSITITIKIQ